MARAADVVGPFYNAAEDLLDGNLAKGRGDRIAIIDRDGRHSYADLSGRSRCFAAVLEGLGIRMDERIALCLLDTADFPVAFLGAIRAGVVPVALNTLLTTDDYAYMLADSRATALVVSEELLPKLAPLLDGHPFIKHVIVSGKAAGDQQSLSHLLDTTAPTDSIAPTRADDMCFWLYTSGSTGRPKGAVHLHAHMARTAELYAKPVLGISRDDVCFSAAKLFFAYGLGNGLSFPFSVGATVILHDGRPTPEAVSAHLRDRQPSLFFGVPTLYGMLLASDDLPRPDELALRLCVSAGEALPAQLLHRWKERTGTDILDGIGSTEMLHIFVSNRPGDIKPDSSGKPVPGYRVRLLDEEGRPVKTGEIGELQIAGPTSAVMYWNQRERSRDTFLGDWTRSGDKFYETEDGYYMYCGRTDDMLKVGGIYVSPFEVEGALVTHELVVEAAVVGREDHDQLIKPMAFVVLREGMEASPALAEGMIDYVKEKLAAYKAPRWIEFRDSLPKTATGKIRRFKLREEAQQQAGGRRGAA